MSRLASPGRVVRDSGVRPAPLAPSDVTGKPETSQEDLQLQIRELTRSNLELRGRLDEQNQRMKSLTDEMDRLRLELDKSKSKKQPGRSSVQ